MEATLTKEKITSIYNEVSEASFYERKNVLSEEQIINTFLDAILVFQKDNLSLNIIIKSNINNFKYAQWTKKELFLVLVQTKVIEHCVFKLIFLYFITRNLYD